MSIEGTGRERLREIGELLKEAGTDGQGFRRELGRQLTAAVRPLAREIGNVEHLKPYMPDRYAAVLAADLSVTTERHFSGSNPAISVVAKGRRHRRKVVFVERGELNHPVFAQGVRRRPRRITPEEYARKLGIPVNLAKGWNWVNGQTAGMRPGFFYDACEAAVPEIQDHVSAALDDTFRKIA